MATTKTSLTASDARRSSSEPGRTAEDVEFYVPPVVHDLLPDQEDATPNLLPYASVFVPLRVEFAMWGNSSPDEEDNETLTLYWNDRDVRTLTWDRPVMPEELFIDVPVDFLSEGRHKLHYQVKLHNNSRTDSEPLYIHIDKTPPLLAEDDALIFPEEVVENGVTDRYLKEHGELVADVPAYLGAAVGDTLSWYWSDSPVGKQLVNRRTLTLADLGTPLQVSIPADFIIQLKDGIRYARYEVQDRAGTAPQRALAVSLYASVLPPPRVLPPPFVRHAVGSDYFSELQPRDAVNGATLVIPASAVLEPGDEVTVFWGEPGAPGSYKTDTPVAPGAREYVIPAEYVARNLNRRIPLHYQVKAYDDERHDSQPHNLTIARLHGLTLIYSDAIRDSHLNLATLGERAEFFIPEWQFMGAWQFISVWIEGVRRGAVHEKVIIPVVTEMPVPGAVPELAVGAVEKADLQRLELDYQFYVRVQVSFDDTLTWVEFPMLTPTLIDKP